MDNFLKPLTCDYYKRSSGSVFANVKMYTKPVDNRIYLRINALTRRLTSGKNSLHLTKVIHRFGKLSTVIHR
ncbi:MAG: hypothetical protein E6689_05510, partial [Corynebacterium striatum]|nr:hypothetical protein [Corynebacterium striatum]